MLKDNNFVCHDTSEDLIAGIITVVLVVILAVMAVMTIGVLIGGFYAVKNYIISFKDNVIMDNWHKMPAETA